MPPVIIYTDGKDRVDPLKHIFHGLKDKIAEELSCEERPLTRDDISMLVLVPYASDMIKNTEVHIDAHPYKARVERQDEISSALKQYIEGHCPGAGKVGVFLSLHELGYSF